VSLTRTAGSPETENNPEPAFLEMIAMSAEPFVIRVFWDENRWRADPLDLPGMPMNGDGRTPEEAIGSLLFRLLPDQKEPLPSFHYSLIVEPGPKSANIAERLHASGCLLCQGIEELIADGMGETISMLKYRALLELSAEWQATHESYIATMGTRR
jgi:hypothetical protein